MDKKKQVLTEENKRQVFTKMVYSIFFLAVVFKMLTLHQHYTVGHLRLIISSFKNLKKSVILVGSCSQAMIKMNVAFALTGCLHCKFMKRDDYMQFKKYAQKKTINKTYSI